MKIGRSVLFFSSLVLQTHAKLNLKVFENHSDDDFLKSLTPNDVGTLHNTVMVRVHDRVLEKEPQTYDHFSVVLYEEMSALCSDVDHECKRSVHETIVRSKYEVKELFSTGKSYDLLSALPEEIDQTVANSLNRVHKSIHVLDSEGLEEYFNELDQILSDVDESEMSEVNKAVVQSVASIARSSGEFWTEVAGNPESIAHQYNGRKMQSIVDVGLDLIGVIQADVVGAVRGAVDGISPLAIIGYFVFSLSLITTFLPGILIGAIGGSLAALGIVIELPSVSEIVGCVGQNIIDPEDVPLVGDFLDNNVQPCNTTTLFGPALGPLFSDLFPGISDFFNSDP